MGAFQQAVRAYEAEVDRVAANLVNQGISPWAALQRANEIVRERRSSRDYEKLLREVPDAAS